MLQLMGIVIIGVVGVSTATVIPAVIYSLKGHRSQVGCFNGMAIGLLMFIPVIALPFLFRDGRTISIILLAVGLVGIIMLILLTLFLPRARKKCPECAQFIPANASTCRNCGHEFAPIPFNVFKQRSRLVVVAISVFVVGAVGTALVLGLTGALARETVYVSLEGEEIEVTPTSIPLTRIVVAVQELQRGFRIPREAIDFVFWPINAIPPNAVSEYQSEDKVVGKKVITDVTRGQPITTNMLVDADNDMERATPYGSIFRIPQTPYPWNTAAPPEDITPGLDVVGAIDQSNWRDQWVFTGEANAVLSFTMETIRGDLLPFMMLWSKDSQTWIEGTRETNKQKTTLTVTLPQTGLYVLITSRARLYNGETTGSYCLFMVKDRTPKSCK